jgi:hypothetical protein
MNIAGTVVAIHIVKTIGIMSVKKHALTIAGTMVVRHIAKTVWIMSAKKHALTIAGALIAIMMMLNVGQRAKNVGKKVDIAIKRKKKLILSVLNMIG